MGASENAVIESMTSLIFLAMVHPERPAARGSLSVLDVVLAEPEPRNQRKHAHVLLIAAPERVNHHAVHEEEVGAAGRDLLHADDVSHHPVIERRKPSVRLIARPFAPRRPDDLGAGAPLLEQGAERLRRVLQIRRHHDGRIAAHVMQAAGNGHVRSAIPGEPDAAHARVHDRQALDHCKGVITRVVIDNQPLPVLPQLRHRLREARVQGFQVGGLVECRSENGNHRDTACFSDDATRCCSSSVIW